MKLEIGQVTVICVENGSDEIHFTLPEIPNPIYPYIGPAWVKMSVAKGYAKDVAQKYFKDCDITIIDGSE